MAERSLESIIKEMLREHNVENEANIRKYRRAFNSLIEKLGGDIEVLKKGKRTISFDETEIGFIKFIFNQLYRLDDSILNDFIDDNNEFSSQKVHEFLELLISDSSQSDLNVNEKRQLVEFFSDIFLLSDKRLIDECHSMIDKIAQQSLMFKRQERLFLLSHLHEYLKRYIFFILEEGTIEIEETAESIETLKNRKNQSDCLYDFLPPILRCEYINRDEYILERIQEDDDLREYIEKKIGKKAEEAFSYTALNDIAATHQTGDESD